MSLVNCKKIIQNNNVSYRPVLIPTLAQQQVHDPGLDMAQLGVEAALGRCQLMEASDDGHHIGVRQGYTLAPTRKHTADITHLQGEVEEGAEEKEKLSNAAAVPVSFTQE